MQLTINGNDYELNFGLKFCRDISKDRQEKKGGIDIRLGIENAVNALYTGDVLILPDLIRAATSGLSKKPKDSEIEEFLDGCDCLDKLCEDFLEQLKSQPATKKKARELILGIEKELKKMEKKDL